MTESTTNNNDNTKFQKYCEKVISLITDEYIEKFKETKDEGSRIKLLYEIGLNIKINTNKNNGKDYIAAQEAKTKGNSYFAKKDYNEALRAYNEGIIKCPQNSNEEKELLSILISNRSATYFELRQFKKVFNDIDYLMEIGSYPIHLQYKIWLRKAKCYDALQNEKMAEDAYSKALSDLKLSKFDEKTMESKVKEIENFRKQKIVFQSNQELVPVLQHDEMFIGGAEYIAAHSKITFEQDIYQGRFAKAQQDIEIGTIILEENSHCAVVDTAHSIKNCQYCMVAVNQPVACRSCSLVVYCNTICERLAYKSFHKVECLIQQCLLEAGASVNCAMALRIITQRHFSYFNDKKNKLQDYLRDECKKNLIRKKIYRYDDYDNVFFLCRNQELRNKEELIHYTCMAIFLLRLLKFGKYFPFETEDNVLKDEEVYFGSLILRHLQILQFNAHEISQLQNVAQDENTKHSPVQFENTTIGAGLYPTLALFNHSCDPCIVRYNIKSKVVVQTIKPIKANDIIYENYGPLYMSMPKEERQAFLKSRYWFECLCTPCTELWPMFNEMKENELRIPCNNKQCPYTFSVHYNDEPFLVCNYCHKITSILPNIKGLMALDNILPEAEVLFEMKQFENAMNRFLNGLKLLFQYTKPPHPDMIKIQQRIRSCMLQLGNKSSDFKFEP